MEHLRAVPSGCDGIKSAWCQEVRYVAKPHVGRWHSTSTSLPTVGRFPTAAHPPRQGKSACTTPSAPGK